MTEVTLRGPLVAHGWDQIRVDGIRVEAVVGFSRHEEGLLQPLDVDLVIEVEPPPAYDDDPERVLDYRLLKDELRRDLLGARYRLLETLAEDVARRVLSRSGVRRTTVTVHKPGALTGARDVAVRITRSHGE